MPRTYHGHRRESYVAVDDSELVELRARQRTFHGAYSRTALGNLGYALTILRLFDKRFYKIGLVFLVLSAVLFFVAYLRARHSNHDFADQVELENPQIQRPLSQAAPRMEVIEEVDEPRSSANSSVGEPRAIGSTSPRYKHVIQTKGMNNTRVFGRPFITAGWIVVAVAGAVAAVEIGLLVLVFRVPGQA